MPIFTDQLGRQINLPHTPKRIISLVPSQTELLYDLGLDEEVAGITKFCVHPQHWFRSKQRVGGTKQIDFEKVSSLTPDLIIANKEENIKEQVETLSSIAPVWISDVDSLESALAMIRCIGGLTAKDVHAQQLAATIEALFSKIQQPTSIPSAYLIWKKPYMTVGGDTFIHHMMRRIGLQNVFAHLQRYPSVTPDDIRTLNPKLLILSSEPFPFKETDVRELQAALPGVHICLADGEMFSWYGSRLQLAAPYLQAFSVGVAGAIKS